jgi:hypothetical protein
MSLPFVLFAAPGRLESPMPPGFQRAIFMEVVDFID